MTIAHQLFDEQSTFFRVPAPLDSSRIPAPLRDYSHWFLDLLHRKYVCWDFTEDSCAVELKAEYVRRTLQRNWLPVRNCLESLGVVQCDHLAIDNRKCFSYRQPPHFWETRRVECENARFARKLRENWNAARDRLHPVHRWLESWVRRIDFDAARAYDIAATMDPKPKRRRGKSHAPLTTDDYRTLLREQIRRLSEGNFTVTVDAYGRVHSPITSLPKEMRVCITLDGQPLDFIDIANSQPLFGGLVCRAYCFASDRTRRGIRNRRFFKTPPKYDTRRVRNAGNAWRTGEEAGGAERTEDSGAKAGSCITLCISSNNTGKQGILEGRDPSVFREGKVLPRDLQEYLQLCQDGQLYESVMDRPQSPDDLEERKALRNDAKHEVFVGIYGRTRPDPYRSPVMVRFDERFPTVAGIIRDLKTQAYQHAARTMQFVESSLCIGAVCGRIMRERESVPVLTIHDSFMSTPEHMGYIEDVLRDEFARLGVQPKLHRK